MADVSIIAVAAADPNDTAKAPVAASPPATRFRSTAYFAANVPMVIPSAMTASSSPSIAKAAMATSPIQAAVANPKLARATPTAVRADVYIPVAAVA